MNTKRILAALMGILMLVTLCVPALAYSTPYESAVVDEWKPALMMDGSSNKVSYTDGTLTYQVTNNGQATYSGGSVHLVNDSSLNSNYAHIGTANTAWTSNSNKFVNPQKGVTLDAYLKIENLPKITDSTYLRDDGVNFDNGMPTNILFGGLAFQILCRSNSWTGVSGHTNNVTQAVMVLYDNETLGTNAALIMGTGVRAGTGANTSRPVTFFFNIPEDEYARYTMTFDVANQKTRFYVNGVAQKCDDGSSTEGALALMYYANGTTTGNCFNFCMNGPQHPSTSGNSGTYYCDLYMDQIAIFADALTPDSTNAGAFKEAVPLDPSDLNAWINVAKDLNKKYYTTESWDAIEAAIDAVDLNKEGLKQSQIEAWANDIKDAILAREYVGLDKLYIAQTYSSSNAATNGSAWTCGALLITEAGYSLADYSVSNMRLDSWTRFYGEHVTDGIYRITKVVKGAYRNGNKPAIGADEVVPENGFVFAFHSNEESAAWNPVEGGSQYAAQEFGERNAYAFRKLNLTEGSLVKFENVEVNYDGDSALSTTGTWVHRYTDGVVQTPIYRESANANSGAAEGEPKYLARDQFDGFETSSYIVPVDALPNFILSAQGDGTVTYGNATVGNEAQKYTVEAGATVALTANGDNFSYWMNAKNGAILSTDANLTFKFGVSEMELVAVFEGPAINGVVKYPVTFKDGITGKILAEVMVEEGTLVSADLIPEITAITGYTFKGWYADGKLANSVETYAITGKTTFFARYDFDNSNLFELTVKIGDNEKTYNRRYASLANVRAYGNFSYWTLDGAFLTSSGEAQLSMPKRAVTLEAVYDPSATNFAPITSMLDVFVDENGNLMATMSRDIPTGYTFLESGILLTRKATVSDLTVNSFNQSVTKGVSTASASAKTFGFTKPNMFSKEGTWLVRGYLSYRDAKGNEQTTYTGVYSVDVASAAADGELITTNVAFAIEGEYDPTVVGTEIFKATDYSDSGYKSFFPSTTQADDGTLYAVYYYGPSHAYYNQTEGKLSGVLHLVKSTDNGMTWSDPEVIVDLTDEDKSKGDYNRESRDPNLQKLSDGTLVLTFPVRAPIGKAGLNGSSRNDYWYERAYYMTSIDNGKTWSSMKEIECDYFSKGEPFLYDDLNRTTGCWVKNGSIAEMENGDLIFPLYGAVDCSSRSILETVVVKAKNNGDGTFTFYKEWANGTDTAHVAGQGLGDELAVWAYGDTVYGFARNKINSDYSKNTGGIVYRSTDGGVTWAEYAVENTANNCINQPNFAKITDELVLVNYSVPMASVNITGKRSARPIYGKLFNLKTGEWNEYTAVPVFDVVNAGQTNNDMGNPASILLDDGRIFTVGYSNPSNASSVIVGQYTTIDYYGGKSSGGSGSGSDSLKGENILTENFDSADAKTYVTTYRTVTASSEPDVLTADINDKLSAYLFAADKKGGSTVAIDGGKVTITSNSTRAATPYGAIVTKESIDGDAVMQFDYSFGSIEADGVSGARNRIGFVLYDEELDAKTAPTKFYITPGAVVLDSTANKFTFTHAVNTVYTAKIMYLQGSVYVKMWEKGTDEPAEWMGNATVAYNQGNPFTVYYEARSNSTSKYVQYSATIDNFSVDTVELKPSGLTPSTGLFMNVGKSAYVKVKYNVDLPMSGDVTMTAYSDNEGVAIIDATGKVTARASGVANIIAKYGKDVYSLSIVVR
ncbi:MAG: exo-alpha-sialidase [Clostridia bacterium]|nr:exo-alpha-sialidase [Clostridia bacterium]